MKPKNCLIYYGWLNSFNSAQNGWDNEKVAQELARYSLLVFGDGVQNPSHGDYANTQIILARIAELNPCAKIFGYVSVNQSYANFVTKADQWEDLEVCGIFMDEAGYDYGTVETNDRAAFNAKVDFVHSLCCCSCCFVNSWKPRYVLGTVDDVSFPNDTWNPEQVQSNLDENDFLLMESFAIDSSGAYETGSQWAARGAEWHAYVDELDIKLVGCSVIADGDTGGQAKFDFIYTSACMWNLVGVGSSDTYYGASSAASKMWTRPNIEGMLYCDCEPVIRNIGTKYVRYLPDGLLTVDFATGSETSTRVKY